MVVLIIAAPQDRCILYPYTGLMTEEACFRKCCPEIDCLTISVENINAATVYQRIIHAPVCREQECVELGTFHIVIFKFSRSAFIVHVVWWVSNHEICLLSVQQLFICFRFRSIAADKAVPSKQPDVSLLGNWRFR